MKKILALIFIVLCCSSPSTAQDKKTAIHIVEEYAELLSQWAERNYTNKAQEQKRQKIIEGKIKELLSNQPSFRISNRLVKELAKNEDAGSRPKGYNNKKFFLWLRQELDSTRESGQNFKICFNDFKIVPSKNVINSQKGFDYISCEFKISSKSFHFVSHDLFCIRDFKIEAITPCEGRIVNNNPSFWEKTWKEVRDSQGIGVAYEYGQEYPVNVSLSFYKSLFMLELDFGLADKDNLISTQKVDFTDLFNYKITKGEYKPQYYFTLMPAIYMKYVSVGWGVGVLTLEGETKTEGMATEVNGDNINPKNLDNTVYTNAKYRFFMRPNVKLYIPCSKSISIITSASYNWAWGSKDLSGFTYGLGLRYNID